MRVACAMPASPARCCLRQRKPTEITRAIEFFQPNVLIAVEMPEVLRYSGSAVPAALQTRPWLPAPVCSRLARRGAARACAARPFDTRAGCGTPGLRCKGLRRMPTSRSSSRNSTSVLRMTRRSGTSTTRRFRRASIPFVDYPRQAERCYDYFMATSMTDDRVEVAYRLPATDPAAPSGPLGRPAVGIRRALDRSGRICRCTTPERALR